MDGGTVQGGFFEDFAISSKVISMSRTVTETDIVNFVCNYGFFEELFIDMEYVKSSSIFKERFAPGALTYCIAEGLALQALKRRHFAGMAFLGMEHFVISQPLYCNDTIHVEIEVTSKRETQNKERGIISFHHKVINQRDEVIMEYDVARMTKRSPISCATD
ncbi:MAG: MaoC/PaaZ C-terminal domain-containing protein [Syntrophobacteraceae bacterium]|jgi:acyl dehydratase